MLWHFLQVACETYAVAFLIGFLFALAICRRNSPYSGEEQSEVDKRELYRH